MKSFTRGRVERFISLQVPGASALTRFSSLTLAPSRRSAERMVREIIAEVTLPGCSALLSEQDWMVAAWIDGKAKLRASDKKAIWLIHSLIFHPEHLSSLFHVATFARFWCGPYTDTGGLKRKRTRGSFPKPANIGDSARSCASAKAGAKNDWEI